MPHYPSARILNFALAILLGLVLSSCVAYTRPYRSGYVYESPPAVGVSYYDYWYYPNVQVYFDTTRRVYFYFSNNRWIETRVLPPYWRSRLGNHVPIQSRYKRPYMEHNEHIRKFPSRYRDDRRIPDRQDERYRTYPPAYRETPRDRDERDRNIYRYEPKYAPKAKPSTPHYDDRYRANPPEHQEAPRDRKIYRYEPKYAPKAKPSAPQYREAPNERAPARNDRKAPRANGKEKDQHGKAAKDNRHKQSKDKDQRDDREQDRRDYR